MHGTAGQLTAVHIQQTLHLSSVNADSQLCLGLRVCCCICCVLRYVQYKRVNVASQPCLCLQALLALLSVVHVQVAHTMAQSI